MKGDGSFKKSTKTLTGLDENNETILCQWIETSGPMVYGKTITVSADINGVRRSSSVMISDPGTEDMVYNLFVADGCQVRIYSKWSPKVIGLMFVVGNGTAVVLDRVKLEISDYETPYETPFKPDELLKCLRYYQEIIPAGVGYGLTEQTISYYVPLAVPLRVTGSVVVKNYPKVLMNGEIVAVTEENSFITNKIENNVVVLNIGNFPCVQYAPYTIIHGTIFIDAEFYLEV